MIRVNVKYSTKNLYEKIVDREASWIQDSMKVQFDDVEFNHYMTYIHAENDAIEEDNEQEYGTVDLVTSIDINVTDTDLKEVLAFTMEK
jgi:hypothetical protein